MRPYDVMQLVQRLADMAAGGAEGEVEDLLTEIEYALDTLDSDAYERGYDDGYDAVVGEYRRVPMEGSE